MGMKNPIGVKNEDYIIIGATRTGENEGYALGESEHNFVTWWWIYRYGYFEFHYGHYFSKWMQDEAQAEKKATADLYKRTLKELED